MPISGAPDNPNACDQDQAAHANGADQNRCRWGPRRRPRCPAARHPHVGLSRNRSALDRACAVLAYGISADIPSAHQQCRRPPPCAGQVLCVQLRGLAAHREGRPPGEGGRNGARSYAMRSLPATSGAGSYSPIATTFRRSPDFPSRQPRSRRWSSTNKKPERAAQYPRN